MLRILNCIFLVGFQWAVAQSQNTPDTLIYQAAIKSAKSRVVKIQQAINIGKEYEPERYLIKNGHPFYLSELALPGSIVYHDIFYTDVELYYDVIQDEVITDNFNGKKIMLVKEHISDFNLDGNVFRKFEVEELNNKLKPGFYQVLADGADVNLLAKRIKLIKGAGNYVGYRKVELLVESKNKYYLHWKEGFTQTNNYKSIAKLLKIDSEPIKGKLKKAKKGEEQMIILIKYYISLGK